MTERAKFGPAGNSVSFGEQGYKSYADIPKYTAGMGLDVFEYQCGRGVHIAAPAAAELGALAASAGIGLSVHAPYFISLSSVEEEKRKNSARYLLESAAVVVPMGGRRIILHSGSCGKLPREQALALAKDTLRYCLAELDAAGYADVTLCPETMGKINQLGTLEEVMELCSLDERLVPCIDFGHLNARTHGGIASKQDYAAILDTVEDRLGHERLRTFHSHFSKIEYSEGGEKRHLTFGDTVFGPDPRPLLELVAERELAPTFICESDGTQAEDAAAMKQIYDSLLS
ncbi:MAG: TIM barrel protein [Oscillospiraceae bacterium]|nr:TIM barrel protein [Oscillospiraceae bacterium]